jgi:hypothetical protein
MTTTSDIRPSPLWQRCRLGLMLRGVECGRKIARSAAHGTVSDGRPGDLPADGRRWAIVCASLISRTRRDNSADHQTGVPNAYVQPAKVRITRYRYRARDDEPHKPSRDFVQRLFLGNGHGGDARRL